jgi:hypothetical protein
MPTEPITIDVFPGLFEGDKLTVIPGRERDRAISFDIPTGLVGEREKTVIVVNVCVRYWTDRNAYVLSIDKEEVGVSASGFNMRSFLIDGKGIRLRAFETRVARYNAKKLAAWFAVAPMREEFADMIREFVAVRGNIIPGYIVPAEEGQVAA